jgi:hypothetical protein
MLMVVTGMQRMAVSHFGVMRRLFMIAGFGMLCGFAVMLGRVLVMFGGLLVMLVNFLTVHGRLPARRIVVRGASPRSMKHATRRQYKCDAFRSM